MERLTALRLVEGRNVDTVKTDYQVISCCRYLISKTLNQEMTLDHIRDMLVATKRNKNCHFKKHLSLKEVKGMR